MRNGCSVFVAVLAACIASEPVHAGETGMKFSISPTLVSEYVSPHGHLLHEGPALQTDMRFTWPGGFTAGIWWSTGLNGEGLSSDKADELDPFVGLGRKWGPWSLSLATYYFNFVELDRMKGDLLVFQAELARKFTLGSSHALYPFMRLEERERLPNFDWSRWMPVVGLRHEWAASGRVTLGERLGFLYDSGTPVADSGLLLQYRAGVKCKISKRVALESFVRLSLPLETLDTRKTQVLGGISFAFQ